MANNNGKYEDMPLSELRKLAKSLKVNPSGKGRNMLIRAIQKAQLAKEGKSTAADPGASKRAATKKPAATKATATKKPAAKAKKEEPEEEEDDLATLVKKLTKEVAKLGKRLDALEEAEPETEEEEEEPEEEDAEEAAEDEEEEEEETEEEEEEETEDEEEEEEESEEEAEEEESEEEEEDEPEEEEEEETVDISLAEIESAKLDRLTEVANLINTNGGKIKLTKKTEVLRQSIVNFLQENAEKVVEDAPASKETPADNSGEVYEVGDKVEVMFLDEDEAEVWEEGTVVKIKKNVVVVDIGDGEVADAPFDSVRRPAKKKATKKPAAKPAATKKATKKTTKK